MTVYTLKYIFESISKMGKSRFSGVVHIASDLYPSIYSLWYLPLERISQTIGKKYFSSIYLDSHLDTIFIGESIFIRYSSVFCLICLTNDALCLCTTHSCFHESIHSFLLIRSLFLVFE